SQLPLISTLFPYTTLFRSGLPTVEKHRGVSPYVAAVELIHEANVDDVFIGDSKASIKNLQYIVDYQKDNILNIECSLLPQYQQRSEEHTSELQSRFDLVCR